MGGGVKSWGKGIEGEGNWVVNLPKNGLGPPEGVSGWDMHGTRF